MKLTFDQNFFTQVGLDSGSLTMLGGVTHRFLEPGQYRGAALRGTENVGIFYINVDKDSPAAQANIDLATFDNALTSPGSYDREETDKGAAKFEVNPKGYAVFHVSGGAGGYAVHVQKAVEDSKEQNQFDSRELKGDDIFSAVIIRPGHYSVSNGLGKATAEVTVSYPRPGKTPYRPPAPVSIECADSGFKPGKVDLQPGQALLFQCKVASRIKIQLARADDGPTPGRGRGRAGWKKFVIPKFVQPKAKRKR